MKVWDSIESLAKDIGISERTAWRWLRQGRIKKKKSKDGQIVFVLLEEDSTDITENDTLTTDMAGPVTTDRKEGSMGMSNENRVSVCLSALQVLYMLKSEANNVVKTFESLARIPWCREEVEKDLKVLRVIHEALSELYEKFEKGSQLGDGELRELFTTVLEAKDSWERFWSNQIQELAEVDEDERISLIKASLKKELPGFDTVLESIKFFLASGK